MMALRNVRGRSLRSRVLLAAAVSIVLVIAGFAAFIRLSIGMRVELEVATTAFSEEQAIADGMLRAVTQQLVAGSYFARRQNDASMTAFRTAGDRAYEQIRLYLFRALLPEQRLQLESVKEEQEHLEVAATEAFGLFARGHEVEAAQFADRMVAHGLSLQSALDEFLRMRERDLVALREHQASTFRYLYAGAGGFALLLLLGALYLAHLLNRRISTPLAELIDATGRVGAGDLQGRVNTSYDDEFATVADGFNRMTARLADTKLDLEDRNTRLQAALESLRAMQEQSIQTEKLSAMGRMMAGLAHELNNPLASVLGYAELLGTQLDGTRRVDPAALHREYLRPLLDDALRARALVRDFLNLARQPDLGLRSIRVLDAVEAIVRLRVSAFEAAGLRILVDGDAEACVRAQPLRLEQAFVNIANNALDAMRGRAHGTLSISIRAEGHLSVIRFEDDGPGFDHLDRVLEPFFTTKPVGEGTGLGLALVRQFMEEFGGAVLVENREEGGARVVLSLQSVPRETLPPRKAESESVSVAGGLGIEGARVLVVEDEAPLQRLHQRFLAPLVAQVVVVADVEAAKRAVAENPFDLVISDVRMPGGQSGIDLYRWIVVHHPHLRYRFLFVTGDVADPELAGLIENRPTRVLHKPFLHSEYLERISGLLETPEESIPSSV